MKLFYALPLVLLFCFNASAVCTDGRIGIEIRLSDKTLEMADILSATSAPHSAKQAPFQWGDAIVVYENYYKGTPGRKEILRYGYISTDGYGNFSLEAVSFIYQPPIHITIHYDHEVSHEEGLHGWYHNHKGQDFNLRSLKCLFDELFVG